MQTDSYLFLVSHPLAITGIYASELIILVAMSEHLGAPSSNGIFQVAR